MNRMLPFGLNNVNALKSRKQYMLSVPKMPYPALEELNSNVATQIAKFMGPTWGPPGSCRPQMEPMLASWALLSGRRNKGTSSKHKPALTLSQWSPSGNPVCLALRPQCTLECHWRNASMLPVVFRWSSSGFPVVFQCVPIMQINTGSPLGASISQCGSSGIPVYLWLQWSCSVFQLCKLTLDRHWNTTGC